MLIFTDSAALRQYQKHVLADSLDKCNRVHEADKVRSCGHEFLVGKCTDCGAEPAYPLTCDNRLCPDCNRRRAAVLINEHESMLKQIRYPKMVTLTFLSVQHINRQYIRWARSCFSKLRRRKIFAGVWGGIYSFEFTYTASIGWHPHIHALVGSGYISQAELSEVWEKITGARVVWVESVKKGRKHANKWQAVREVVKYPAKAQAWLGVPGLVDEFLTATKGTCLVYGFGALYKTKTKKPSGKNRLCPVCGSSAVVVDGGGYGFVVGENHVIKISGGYIWRSPPVNAVAP